MRSRRDLVYLAATAETLPISPSYWRDLGEISFISPRSQRHNKSRRVLDEMSARCRLSRRDRRDITNLAELWRDLGEISFISPRSQKHYKSRRVLVEISLISTRSRRDLRDITNLAEISSGLTRSRRDLAYLA